MEEIFQRVFGLPDLVLSDDTPFDAIPGWDSLSYVNLIFNIEQTFGLRFSDAELDRLHAFGRFGELKGFVESKAAALSV